MSVLAFVEVDEGAVKKSSLEAVSYGSELGDTTAIIFGDVNSDDLEHVGKAGAKSILHVKGDDYNTVNALAYSSAIAAAIEEKGFKYLVLAKSSMGDPIAARVSIKSNASLISSVADLPESTDPFVVKRSIYTGKAFARTEVKGDRIIVTLKKNAAEIKTNGGSAAVEEFSPAVAEADKKIKVTSQEKATGDVLLPEADIVVSGGRGLKGPENWNVIEDLAKELGAATGCSKPVSDMDWRPHHEHVGQTGVKVAPTLYVAAGISGAIQHLAGVNSSKYILVINKDPEAPFFKAADYGVVGDAFEVLPKLTEAIKATK
jgi:electron transfer flavoprotein alpha subunit